MFEIPFTKSGKTHGEMAEQYKRKTILTVEAAFPHLKKRLKIINKSQIEVPPIENAIDLLDKKVHAMKAELQSAVPNTKTLQIILQGCLLLQVNAGPLEICRVFLSEGDVKKGCTQEQINKLIDVMREFTRKLGFALKLNLRLVEARDQQIQVQEQLEASYQDFVREVTKYLSLEVESVV